jgi:hypothetical protein
VPGVPQLIELCRRGARPIAFSPSVAGCAFATMTGSLWIDSLLSHGCMSRHEALVFSDSPSSAAPSGWRRWLDLTQELARSEHCDIIGA